MVGCLPQFNHQTVKGERRVGIPLLTEVVLKKVAGSELLLHQSTNMGEIYQ